MRSMNTVGFSVKSFTPPAHEIRLRSLEPNVTANRARARRWGAVHATARERIPRRDDPLTVFRCSRNARRMFKPYILLGPTLLALMSSACVDGEGTEQV